MNLSRTNPHRVSKMTRRQKKLLSDEYLYGEINLLTLVKLIDLASPQKDEVFFDLGSGAGDAIFMADYCYEFSQCTGIEILPALFQLSERKQEKYKEKAIEINPTKSVTSHFIQDNFLKVDFSTADIVFINATAFKGPTWDNLSKLLKLLKPGSRVIVTSLKLKAPDFELIYSANEVMSWGFCSVRIFKRL
jgi:SAM-dependent methyltransferase